MLQECNRLVNVIFVALASSHFLQIDSEEAARYVAYLEVIRYDPVYHNLHRRYHASRIGA